MFCALVIHPSVKLITLYIFKNFLMRELSGKHFFVVVQLLNHVQLFVTPRTAAHQASLSSTISPSLLKFMSIESVMLSNLISEKALWSQITYVSYSITSQLDGLKLAT